MPSPVEVNVTVDLWHHNSQGVKRITVTGPHQDQHRLHEPPSVFRLNTWIKSPTDNATPPDFYAELDRSDVMNLRNALGSVLFSQGQ